MKVTRSSLSLFTAAVTSALIALPSILLASSDAGPEVPLSEVLIWDVGLKALNVFVLFFFLYKLLSKPLARFVEVRSEKVREELEEAKAGRRAAEERLREFEEKASHLDSELDDLKKQTCSDIEREQKILFEESRLAAEHIREHTKVSIRQEVAKARADLQQEAAVLATELATELIKKNINADDQDRLVGEYLKQMEAVQ